MNEIIGLLSHNFCHLLGNELLSTKDWKRNLAKNPVPKTHMYATTASIKFQA